MSSIPSWLRGRLWAVLLAGVAGCAPTEPEDDRLKALNPKALVPVSGVVTINGKPLRMVVVTFLPPHGPALATAETDENGKYEVESMGGPGALPGDYKVSLSYLTSEQGEPQTIAARTALIQSRAMLTAKEQLPKAYSDLGRTKLSAKVGPQGGRFDFDVPVEIPAVAAKPAGKKAAAAHSAEEKTPSAGLQPPSPLGGEGKAQPAAKEAGAGKAPEPKSTEKKPG